MAQNGGLKRAEHVRSARVFSDINLFRYCQSIVYFDPEISDRALDLRVTEQELDRPQVAGAPACRYYRFFFFAKIAFQLSL